jgi:hypothetical protein
LHAATITKKALRPFSDYLTRRQCNASDDNGIVADKQAFNSTGHHVFLSSFASGPLKPPVSVTISILYVIAGDVVGNVRGIRLHIPMPKPHLFCHHP